MDEQGGLSGAHLLDSKSIGEDMLSIHDGNRDLLCLRIVQRTGIDEGICRGLANLSLSGR